MKTKFKSIFLSALMLTFVAHVYGQRYCGSVMNIAEIQQNDPARYQRIMELEDLTQSYIERTALRSIEQSTIIIPVVVHIVYNTNNSSTQNISDAQIYSQIQVLNEDYQRLNEDRVNTPAAFAGVAGDVNLEFKLAKIDPNGNVTTGITRTSTTKTGFSYITDDVKFTSKGGHDAWNAQRYLNIWVCNFSDSGLMGYAQFPSDLSTRPNTDGVVISYKFMGREGALISPYDKGRTTTHEIGHWLNLRHIWGDANNCSATDFVDDTPNQYTNTSDCPSFPQVDNCSPSYPGIMFMNYMDYSSDDCMNLFTVGQVMRMRALFDTGTGVRRQMLEMAEYLTTDCTLSEAPVAIDASDLTPVGFTANWKALENADKYFLSVYQKDIDENPVYLEGFKDREVGNKLLYSITDLSHNTKYFYSVKGRDCNQITEASNEISVTTLPPTFECLYPVATEATDISGDSFVANWEALPEALSYELNVYQKLEATDFEDAVDFTDRKMSTGWTKNSIIFYTQPDQYGKAAPSLRLGNDEYVQSPDYEKAVKSLSFWYRGISASANNALTIFGYIDQKWVELQRIKPISNSVGGTTFTTSDIPESCTAIKILHTRTSGYTAIDDIVLQYGTYPSIEYVQDFELYEVGEELFYSVNDLEAESEYYYSVRAFNGESHSKVSNEIAVVTGSRTAIPSVTVDRKSWVSVDEAYIYIHSNETDQPVLLVNTLGQVIFSRLMPENMAISRRNLPSGIYFVKVGTETFKVRL
jgi:hypothetical protein